MTSTEDAIGTWSTYYSEREDLPEEVSEFGGTEHENDLRTFLGRSKLLRMIRNQITRVP